MRLVGAGHAIVGRLRTHTFSALFKHPNFRLYWFGALASNIGTWIQMVAQSWLVYDLTGSTLFLGLVGFATAIPSLFLALFGGVLADRFERRRLMMATQTGSMLLAFVLASLTLTGITTVWHIMVIAFLNGAVNALNTPVRQTIISDLVSKEDLTNAIAIGSAQFQTSRMLGPAIAGAIIALVGPGWCFFINGLSFLVVIAALFKLKVPPLKAGRARVSMWRNMRDGLGYIRSEPTILSLLALAAIPSIFGMPYIALMPAFASSVLHVGPHGLGLLMSAAGLGAVCGALAVASLQRGSRRGRLMLGAIVSFGLCLAAFAVSHVFVFSFVFLIGVGISSMTYNSLNQSFLQSLADDEMRGRVMSLLTLTTFGMQPFGQLGAGALANYAGPSFAVLLGGVVCVLFALLMLAKRPTIRRLV
ncbi:MAG: MFS transporter [Dehalococcoidia bacterium]|nr:MFS transporter [Dehalococcoidia bacterium]